MKKIIIDNFPESCRDIIAQFTRIYKVKTLSDFSINEMYDLNKIKIRFSTHRNKLEAKLTF